MVPGTSSTLPTSIPGKNLLIRRTARSACVISEITQEEPKMMNSQVLSMIGACMLAVGGTLLVLPSLGYSQTQTKERRDDRQGDRKDSRDTKQTGRQEGRDTKDACKDTGNNRSDCRQDKRDTKQEARGSARDTKRKD
jgi:hypothetical protein